jgi:hypothetical protein
LPTAGWHAAVLLQLARVLLLAVCELADEAISRFATAAADKQH